MADTPPLTGEGFTLRAYRPSDVDGIVAYRNDPVTQAYVGSSRTMARERALWFITEVARPREDQTMWVIDVDGEFAGSVELTTWGRGFGYGAAKVGYGTHPDHRGQGLATAASRLVVDWVFARGVTTIVWQAVAGNEASWRVARSIGFTERITVPALLPLPDGLADAWHSVLQRPRITAAGAQPEPQHV